MLDGNLKRWVSELYSLLKPWWRVKHWKKRATMTFYRHIHTYFSSLVPVKQYSRWPFRQHLSVSQNWPTELLWQYWQQQPHSSSLHKHTNVSHVYCYIQILQWHLDSIKKTTMMRLPGWENVWWYWHNTQAGQTNRRLIASTASMLVAVW